eukprot:2653492-Pyramimonas_sp.AAC.1
MAPAAAAPMRDEADENWTMVTSRRNRSKASDCAPLPCKQRVAGDIHAVQAPVSTRSQRASTSGSCCLRPMKDETAPRCVSYVDPWMPERAEAALSLVTPCGGIAGGSMAPRS